MELTKAYDHYRYSNYYRTELPAHWVEKRLSFLAKEERTAFVDGPFGSDLKSSDYKPSGVPLIQLNNIRDSKHLLRNMKFVTEEKKEELCRHVALPGDVVVAKMAEPVARAAIVANDYPEYVIVADCIKMTPNLRLVDLRFLVWAINCDVVRINAELVSTGTTRIRISLGELKKLKIPFPPSDEQKLIANFLDHETAKIDILIEEQQSLIRLLKEKRQAVISHAVTKGLNPDAPIKDSGVEWLGEVPKHWEVQRLKDLLVEPMKNGLFKKKDQFGSGSLLVNVSDLYVDEHFIEQDSLDRVQTTPEEREVYKVDSGDIFFVRSSLKLEGIGRSACFLSESEDVVFECHIVNGKPKKQSVSPKFLTRYLNSQPVSQEFIRRSKTTTMTTIDQGSLATISTVRPPLEEAYAIDAFLDHRLNHMNSAVTDAERSIKLLEERRTALISAAVTGKIDVRGWKNPQKQH
ncbi:hypothetical protein GZ77_19075 [Endozoicomonas montiporae]|uniref:Type I restriction modification DNA specificity domain-containing protein n=2 Tax=Endozoicomonas montiporae TaxID=1027273 RepID=A0A081N2D4_9GAMM|nr:restriction endonuclease subunit S [Endozoicomonas montiporae]AMO58430.1 type I site-specific deoxyribonuclease specificity subunit [Endozoicomonas montiporae CL-33]KEQ12607.1 hypothetical protein GZ77_19075 [Endozoicomonas montiporae]